jgi:predicted CXXCH cytochrome family protein
MNARRNLGQILLDGGLLTRGSLDAALEEQRRTNELIGQVLVRMRVLDPLELQSALLLQERLGSPEAAVKVLAGVRQTLGALLLQAGRLTQAQLDEALAVQRRTGERLGEVLVRRGHLTEAQLERALQAQEQLEAHGESPLRLGDLLLAGGFITREQLHKALGRQETTGERLGDALVSLGFAQLSQVAACLRLQRGLLTSALVALLSLADAGQSPAQADEGRAARAQRPRSPAAAAAAAAAVAAFESDALAVTPIDGTYGTKMEVTLPRPAGDASDREEREAEESAETNRPAAGPLLALVAPARQQRPLLLLVPQAQRPAFLSQQLAPGTRIIAGDSFARAANEDLAHTCGLQAGRDQDSQSCLACHSLSQDGRGRSVGPIPQHGGSHPVDVSYARAAEGMNPSALRPISELRHEVRLDAAGNVTCTSCHDGASAQKDKLAVSKSKHLCLACHDYASSKEDAEALAAR